MTSETAGHQPPARAPALTAAAPAPSPAPAPEPTPETRRSWPRRIWSLRWPALRLALALWLLTILLRDNPARLARLQFGALPDFDYVSEVQRLREQQRFGEAILIGETGLKELTGPAHDRLYSELEKTKQYRDSNWRRLKLAARGAVIGQGDTLEELVGAVSADFLVVGDVRDLLIQGARYAVDREADELIVLLSGVGLATTVAPQVDWMAAVLKVARKTGTMSRKLGDAVVVMLRRAKTTGNYSELTKIGDDLWLLSSKASPAGALHILRHADAPADIKSFSRFASNFDDGAFALHVTGKEGAGIVKHADDAAQTALVTAAKKGDAGLAWLRTRSPRLLRPHPILGLSKALYKRTGIQLTDRLAKEILDPLGLWTIGGVSLWVFFESVLIYRRLVIAAR
jgi:hypothetical protein